MSIFIKVKKNWGRLLFVLCIIATLMIAIPTTGYQQSNINDHTEGLPSSQMLVRIQLSNREITLPKDIEIVGGRPGEWLDIIIPRERCHELTDMNITFTVIIEDVEAYSNLVRGSYHTLAEIEQIMQTIATNYPSITRLYSIGGTYQNRQIWCIEITDNPGVAEGEPGVFFMGLHHAREWPTVEICLYIANQLTSLYGSDPVITNMVNNRRIWIVPCVNPDGYYRSHDQGVDWRKNMHYFPQYGTTGVDLNRNYEGSCDGNILGAWGSIHAASVTHKPSQETYCGPGRASELETQAIRDLFLNNDICASISWHTYGELVMWPWGYGSATTPDNQYLVSIGQQIASRITRDSGSGTYTPQQSYVLYPTTGDTDDWAYGYAHYVQGRNTFAYTIEACSQFQPSASKLDQICKENWDGALYLLQESANIQNVVPRVMPPVFTDVIKGLNGNYTLKWRNKNPMANPDYYQLDELTGFTTILDNGESGTNLWNLEGFSLSTQRYYSPTNSYKSRNVNKDCSAMTSVYPLPVTKNTALSFWCWYNIETDYDKAFVEVSTDKRYYEILDSFTGSSGSWLKKTYNLSKYEGASVYIRFRYTTDAATLNEGFYIDDIYPTPYFSNVNTLSASIVNTSFTVHNRPEDDYYYRVKGHNPQRGWGDYSPLKKVHIRVYILGDINCDGAVNFGDINPFILALTSGETAYYQKYPDGYYYTADINQDGYVDFGDINPFVRLLTGG
ncbi:MAG: M14 family zinc carboxypeptidase [Candidatus Thermoplasmatota archaeon]